MRFKRPHGRSTRQSGTARDGERASPTAAAHDPTGWRSLWSRVYERWMTTATPSEAPFSIRAVSCRSQNAPRRQGFRSYLHRERGELWFLTRRRRDSDKTSCTLCEDPPADEVEVPPPPCIPPPPKNEKSRPNCHQNHHHVRLKMSHVTPKPMESESVNIEWHDSEIEIAMASYSSRWSRCSDLASLSSFGSSSSNSDDASNSDDSDDPNDSDNDNDNDPQDPFLQRYSSWYSVDDEAQHPNDQEEDSSQHSETEYEVRYVDMGRGTLTPVRGIWV